MNKPAARPEVFSVAPYVGGESKLPGVETPLKLSSNEGAFGPPPGAIKAMAEAAATMHRYPDGSSAALRHEIGAKFGLDPARIVCGNGSDELLVLLIQSYGGPGTELIMSEHGFSVYEIAGKIAGCTVKKAPETNLTTDVDAMLALVTRPRGWSSSPTPTTRPARCCRRARCCACARACPAMCCW